MYTKGKNGERLEVDLPVQSMRMTASENKNLVQVKEAYEKPEGSNKLLLYIALVFGIAVVIGSAYMLYRDNKKKSKNDNFGYTMN